MQTPSSRWGAGTSRFLALAPALLLAALCLRAWALWAGMPANGWSSPDASRVVAYALGDDLLWLARGLPLLFLFSWPLLALRNARVRLVAVTAFWTAWLLPQLALEQYFLATRVPLGADLFGYSLQEIRTAVGGNTPLSATSALGWLMPPALLWVGVVVLARRRWQPSAMACVAVLLVAAALCAWPWRVPAASFASDDAYNLALNKPGYFFRDALAFRGGEPLPLLQEAKAGASDAMEETADPDYPFLHRERTPDVLGAHFHGAQSPPHLVFIIVEGLGRSFSGPDAALGSFTPFLDELAARSLYWDNFLANQGRTFGVLPSLFGSLPFGEEGVAALGERMPPHAGLLRLLKAQGYRLNFYIGFNTDFDNERGYLQAQGVDRIVDSTAFDAHYRRNPYSEWGYDDHELIARVLADLPDGEPTPSLTIIQTMSMHTSYRFPRQDEYRRRVERRLDELRIAGADKSAYRQFADIYSSILFTDDALRRYFDAVSRQPAHANTVYVITGDHRLPEIPMDTRIERYHVPLIVYSPRLKQPARFRGVASHLDVAPSLLAFLANGHGLRRPREVAWTGQGLDTSATFRNLRDIPLKQTKTALADFVSGRWYYSRGQLFELHDGLRAETSTAAAGLHQVTRRFALYRDANAQFARTLRLSPSGAMPELAAYDASAVAMLPPASATGELHVREVHAPEDGAAGPIAVTAWFANGTAAASPPIVPLLVVTSEDGRQVHESYGAALHLAPGAAQEVRFALAAGTLATGRYYLAVIPSHPDTGKPIGAGRYRIPLRIRG